MSPTIRNVAIAGASGNVGAPVLDALLKTNQFNVTVLSRSPKSFPTGAEVKVVDFTSIENLTAALTGQDAVIDATSASDTETPLRLIEAAANAGVYRFITSEFGLDPEIPGVYEVPVFSRKKVTYDAVKKLASENRLTYTSIACGALFDWCLATGFAGFNFQEKTAWLFDDGDNVFPWTALEDVGLATANVLLHPEETANRPVYIHSVFMSQNQVLDVAKEVLGGDWSATCNDMETLLREALEDLGAGRISVGTFVVQIQYCLAKKSLARPWDRDDNSLLGLEEWNSEKVRALIGKVANQAKAA